MPALSDLPELARGDHPPPGVAEKIASYAVLTVIARSAMVATPFVLALIGWLLASYLDGRFAVIQTTTATVSSRVDQLTKTVDDLGDTTDSVDRRVVALETGAVRDRRDLEELKLELTGELRDMRSVLNGLATGIASLNASMQLLRDQLAANRPPTVTR